MSFIYTFTGVVIQDSHGHNEAHEQLNERKDATQELSQWAHGVSVHSSCMSNLINLKNV